MSMATYPTTALQSLEQRSKDLDPRLWSYKLGGSDYAMDVVMPDKLDYDLGKMSLWIPFADGNRRDGVGDLLEVGGIRLDRHRRNPICLLDHGKKVDMPLGMACEWDDETGQYDKSKYTVRIDPESRQAWLNCFFYRGKNAIRDENGNPVVNSGTKPHDRKQYDHALYCEQIYDMAVKGMLSGGSIGYQVERATQLPADYERGTPAGMHLIAVLMLEGSLVVMPANQDTVRKSYGYDEINGVLCRGNCCGKSLSPYLVKALSPYALPKKATLGYEPQRQTKSHSCSCGGSCGKCGSKSMTVPVPHGDHSKTKIPPPDWIAGWGAKSNMSGGPEDQLRSELLKMPVGKPAMIRGKPVMRKDDKTWTVDSTDRGHHETYEYLFRGGSGGSSTSGGSVKSLRAKYRRKAVPPPAKQSDGVPPPRYKKLPVAAKKKSQIAGDLDWLKEEGREAEHKGLPKHENVDASLIKVGDRVTARSHLAHVPQGGKTTHFAKAGEPLEVIEATPYRTFKVRNRSGQVAEFGTSFIRRSGGKKKKATTPKVKKPKTGEKGMGQAMRKVGQKLALASAVAGATALGPKHPTVPPASSPVVVANPVRQDLSQRERGAHDEIQKLTDAQEKSLDALKAKYRPKTAKGLRHRLKKSTPGSSMVFVRNKDIHAAQDHAVKAGLKCEYRGRHASGLEKLKLTGDDKAIDDVAVAFGRPVKKSFGTKNLSTTGGRMTQKIQGRTKAYVPPNEGMPPPEDDLPDEEMGDEAEMMDEDMGEPMPPEMEDEGDMGGEEPVEPYSAQMLRRAHQDYGLLMEEYDEAMQHLEHPEVLQHFHEMLEDFGEKLDKIEQLMETHHPDLPPPEGAMADRPVPEGGEGDFAEEAELADEDTGEEAMEEEGMDEVPDEEMAEEETEADSDHFDEDEEPTGDEALEGMQTKALRDQYLKSLRHRYAQKSLNGKAKSRSVLGRKKGRSVKGDGKWTKRYKSALAWAQRHKSIGNPQGVAAAIAHGGGAKSLRAAFAKHLKTKGIGYKDFPEMEEASGIACINRGDMGKISEAMDALAGLSEAYTFNQHEHGQQAYHHHMVLTEIANQHEPKDDEKVDLPTVPGNEEFQPQPGEATHESLGQQGKGYDPAAVPGYEENQDVDHPRGHPSHKATCPHHKSIDGAAKYFKELSQEGMHANWTENHRALAKAHHENLGTICKMMETKDMGDADPSGGVDAEDMMPGAMGEKGIKKALEAQMKAANKLEAQMKSVLASVAKV